MKFVHISDLHLGRTLYRFPLQEHQETVLSAILNVVCTEQPDAVLIAGDVYDRGQNPPVYAIHQLSRFLESIAGMNIPVFLCCGNHDSADRLSFLSGTLQKSGLHITPVYSGHVEPVTLYDEDGPVNIWMLPYLKPSMVRSVIPAGACEHVTNANDAVAWAIQEMCINPEHRNVLVAHQFVSGGKLSGEGQQDAFGQEMCGSEETSVGGLDMVDAGNFAAFDYVALGHLHRPQNVSERIRYCGTPLRYSFAEVNDKKSVTVVELAVDKTIHMRLIPLPEPYAMQRLRGTFDELMSEKFLAHVDRNALTDVTMLDSYGIDNVASRLRVAYPNFLTLTRIASNMQQHDQELLPTPHHRQSPLELISHFYEEYNDEEPSTEQLAYLRELIGDIWEVNE